MSTVDANGSIHDQAGLFAGHLKGEAVAGEVLTDVPEPGVGFRQKCDLMNARIANLESELRWLAAERNTYSLAYDAANVMADYPGAHSMTLVSWNEEAADNGDFEVTLGAILDADGNELAETPEGCMVSTQMAARQPWVAAYTKGGPDEYWDGTLDLRELVRIGEELAEQNRVKDHIEQVCEVAGYPTMAEILQVSLEREELEDEHYLAITADDVDALWDGYVGRAVDRIEASLRGDYN